jgi:hypothetical protein
MELDDSDERGQVGFEIVAGDRTRATVTGQIEGNDPSDVSEAGRNQAPVAGRPTHAVDEHDRMTGSSVVLDGDR